MYNRIIGGYRMKYGNEIKNICHLAWPAIIQEAMNTVAGRNHPRHLEPFREPAQPS